MNTGKPQCSLRILVADDCSDARDSLALLLELWGHDVATAEDGLAALSLASSFRPDVALLDLTMPGLDGYQVARRLRQNPTPILLIAVSGYGQPEHVTAALAAGFDHHLVKPLDTDLLHVLLEACTAVPAD